MNTLQSLYQKLVQRQEAISGIIDSEGDTRLDEDIALLHGILDREGLRKLLPVAYSNCTKLTTLLTETIEILNQFPSSGQAEDMNRGSYRIFREIDRQREELIGHYSAMLKNNSERLSIIEKMQAKFMLGDYGDK